MSPGRRLAVVVRFHLPWLGPEGDRAGRDYVLDGLLPVLDALAAAAADNVPCRVAVVVTPTLAATLASPAFGRALLRQAESRRRLATQEADRLEGQPEGRLAEWYEDRSAAQVRRLADPAAGDIPGALRRLEDAGAVELATAAAVDLPLPALAAAPGWREALVDLAMAQHGRLLGRRPAGLWLPACAWDAGVGAALLAAGVGWTVTEVWDPAEGGVLRLSRDRAAARLLGADGAAPWADPAYRDPDRDVGLHGDLAQVRPYLPEALHRAPLSMGWWARPGRDGEAGALWSPEEARARAAAHAADLLGAVWDRDEPVTTCVFDAALFGPGWLEAPWVVEGFLRAAASAAAEGGPRLLTPGDLLAEGLAGAPPAADPLRPLPWIDGGADWVHRHLAEVRDRAAPGRLRDAVLAHGDAARIAAAGDGGPALAEAALAEDAFAARVRRCLQLDGADPEADGEAVFTDAEIRQAFSR